MTETSEKLPDPSTLSIEELATRINRILRKLETSDWNSYEWTDRNGNAHKGTHFFHAWCAADGKQAVRLRYVSYHGDPSRYDREQAEDYLLWLRAGNKGTISQAERAGAVRKSKKQQEREAARAASEVAYQRPYRGGGDFDRDVHAKVRVPDDAPSVKAASDLVEGDKVWWDGRWQTVKTVVEYDPPLPEDIQALEAEMRHRVLMGEYDEIPALADQIKRAAEDLALDRHSEIRANLAGGASPTLLRNCQVAVKATKKK